MSASSTRRLKPSKPLTPVSISSKNATRAVHKSSSIGKENPGPPSRPRPAAQKPAIRSMPRVDKAAASLTGPGNDGNTRLRWSTSSAPRGRSPSPSEFIRVFSDRRVSVGVSGGKGLESGKQKEFRYASVKGCEGNSSAIRVFRDRKEKIGVNLEKKRGVCEESEVGKRGMNLNKVGVLENCNGEVNLSLKLIKSSETGLSFDDKFQDAMRVDEVLKSNEEVFKVGNGVDLYAEESGGKSLDKGTVSESLKQKKLRKGVGGRFDIEYPSKLHEKLALLEGKVKRIASDIKRTKEMLDRNNPDASKLILSDIQDQISGVQKVMGDVGGESDGKMALPKKNDGESGIVEKGKSKMADNAKNFVKGLASLNKGQNKVAGRDGQADMEFCEVQEMDGATSAGVEESSNTFNGKCNIESILTSDETLDEFDDQENMQGVKLGDRTDDTCIYELNEIGRKTSTGGWFVSEGEAVLAHDDGSCSFYDITNSEEKAEYRPPTGLSPDIWRDCWVIRAPGADGCLARYIVAASAGNAMDSGFCSWDFYTKDVRAFQIEGGATASRTVLGSLPYNIVHRRADISNIVPENQQWWYKPCGPLIISTATCQKGVRIFDIRDGEQVMKWEVQKPVSTMEYSSPVQWRNRGKVVLTEAETISVWDVNSPGPQALLSVSSSGRKVSALHVNNSDAELGGGVRKRVSSSEAEGNDGVFCTTDSINILDFRHPSGVGLKIPKLGVSAQSVFSRGDSIFLGCTSLRSSGRKQPSPQLQEYSLRQQRLFGTYTLPESEAHFHYTAITQVWGSSNLVMGVCGLGLFVFDTMRDDSLQSFTTDSGNTQKVRDIIGPDDMYSPSFDYLSSCALLISRDRPAVWRHLSEV